MNAVELVISDLIEITESQFDKWCSELNNQSKENINPDISVNYWYILSGIYRREAKGMKVEKEEAFGFIPKAKENTGRKYVSNCSKYGLIVTSIYEGKRYVSLSEGARKAVENTAKQWITDFGRFQSAMLSAQA